ncbi:MAG TPA: Era-like GTP-binding protein [Bacteroidales bacterium]|nr:Era-like GTP-binding protein [Bacteroidales bacterium]
MNQQLNISFTQNTNCEKADIFPYIGIFGRKNSGKSSFINAITNQEFAPISKVAGSTKEPGKYITTIENIGNVIIYDTSGIDDYGEAGEKRIQKTKSILKKIDFAILLITDNLFAESEKKIVRDFQTFAIPFIVVQNKSDLQGISSITKSQIEKAYLTKVIEFSCLKPTKKNELIFEISNMLPAEAFKTKSLLGDLVKTNDVILLVTQDETDISDQILTFTQIEIANDLIKNACIPIFSKLSELKKTLEKIPISPALTIAPATIYSDVALHFPSTTMITTYGIVMAHYKGGFEKSLSDTRKIDTLKEGDHILILQLSNDHTCPEFKEQNELQILIDGYLNKKLNYSLINIFDSPIPDIKKYQFVIFCGCFHLTKKQIANQLSPLFAKNIPISSFDLINAFVKGIFERATIPFKT